MRHRTTIVCLALASILGLASQGCGADPLGPETDALSRARARWAAAGIDSYVFDFQRLCFCGGDVIRPVLIDVLDGEVSSATFLDTGEPVTDPAAGLPTIEDLFEEIQSAIDRNAHSVVARYDPDLGYPSEVSIDFLENAIDEEMAFSVSSLSPSGP